MKREREDDEEQGVTAPADATAASADSAGTAAAADTEAASSSTADFAPPEGAGLLGSATFWYYRDANDQEQGPHQASTMRAWFEAGFFYGVSVAPTYYGEVPETYWPIETLWQAPAAQAFMLAGGVEEVQATEEAAPFIPAHEFAGERVGYVFTTREYGVGYYEDVSHVNADGVPRWGPRPEVTAASMAKHKAEALAMVRNVGYDENVTA